MCMFSAVQWCRSGVYLLCGSQNSWFAHDALHHGIRKNNSILSTAQQMNTILVPSLVLRTCTFHWFLHCSPRDIHVWLVDKVDVSYLFKPFSFETSLIFSLPSSECTVQNPEWTPSMFNQPVFENASHCWISLSRCQCTYYWRTSRRIFLSLLPLLLSLYM